MAKTSSNDEFAQRIEKLVSEHIAESRRMAQEALERAFASTATRALLTAGTRSRAVAPRSRRQGRRRPPEEVAAIGERLYAAVCANPGEGMTLLAQQVGLSVRELHRPMTCLKRAGRIRIAHTARKQSRNVVAFVTECCRARSGGATTPSLFGAPPV